MPACPQFYGIANCDTVKKARAWAQAQHLAVEFIDFKKVGVPAEALDHWIASVGWTVLVNRAGTTWRKLAPQAQAAVVDAQSARAVLLAHPSLVKRPVVQWPSGQVTVGFSAAVFAANAACASIIHND